MAGRLFDLTMNNFDFMMKSVCEALCCCIADCDESARMEAVIDKGTDRERSGRTRDGWVPLQTLWQIFAIFA